MSAAYLGWLLRQTNGDVANALGGYYQGLTALRVNGPLTITRRYVAGVGAGLLIGAVFAVFVIALRADQIVTGTALTMAAFGVTGTLFRGLYGAAGALPSMATSAPRAVTGLLRVPWLGPAFFVQPWVTYLSYALVPLLWLYLYRTHAGLALRAVGDAPQAALVSGVRVARVRFGAVMFGSAMGGLAGATLVLAQAGTFAEGMSAGRGFMAIAIVALGRWHPAGVFASALLFGAAMAVQFVVQALGWGIRYELVLMVPYLLTLLALVVAGRGTAPAWLGRDATPTD